MGKPSWFRPKRKPTTLGQIVDLLQDFNPGEGFSISISIARSGAGPSLLSLMAYTVTEEGDETFSAEPLCLCKRCLAKHDADMIAFAMMSAVMGKIKAAREVDIGPIEFKVSKPERQTP
jgi:hypothetical protein